MLQNFAVPAGGRQIAAQATYFRIEGVSASGADESVKVRADGQDLGVYLPGDSIRLPVAATLWEAIPVTATATASVRVGVAGVESSRIFGNVRIVDDARSRSISDIAFAGGGAITGAADQQAHMALSNPAGSGRRLVVSQFGISAYATAGAFILSINTAQSQAMTGDAYIRNPVAKNQKPGATPKPSVAEIRSLSSATGLPGVTAYEMFTLQSNAALQKEVRPTEPMVLWPGTSLIIRGGPLSGGAAVTLAGWFDFCED